MKIKKLIAITLLFSTLIVAGCKETPSSNITPISLKETPKPVPRKPSKTENINQKNNSPVIRKLKNKDNNSPFGIHELTEIRTGDFTNLHEAGVKWVRLPGIHSMLWDLVEKEKGTYDWQKTDQTAKTLTEEGFNIMWNVGNYNRLSGERKKKPSDMQGYLKFLSAAIERYDGDGKDDAPSSPVVTYWQIGNEPDGFFWEDSPENFAELLKKSIITIKKANPNAKVVIGGASIPKGYYDFYPKVFAEFSESDPFFDVMDVHWYENVGDYDTHPIGKYNLIDFMKDLKSTLSKYGDIEIWFTEVGTHTGTKVENRAPQTESAQAIELFQRYIHFIANGVNKVFWCTMSESASYSIQNKNNNFFDNNGLIYNGFSYINDKPVFNEKGVGDDLGENVKKLSFYTYKLLSEKITGFDSVEIIQQSKDVYIYKFINSGNNILMAWQDVGNEKELSIEVGNLDYVKITEVIPNTKTGKELDNNNYPNFFNTGRKKVNNGKLIINLKKIPVLIETCNLNCQNLSEYIPSEINDYNIKKNSPEKTKKCGDGICGPVEEKNNICPQDCNKSPKSINKLPNKLPSKCGDGICGPVEKRSNICPQDCKNTLKNINHK